MLTAALLLTLELPPLAFGPALPPPAFARPRELTCPVRDLGRLQAAPLPLAPPHAAGSLAPRTWKPARETPLVHPVVDALMVFGALAATHGSWDDRGWATRTWQTTGAVTPVLIPPAWTPRP